MACPRESRLRSPLRDVARRILRLARPGTRPGWHYYSVYWRKYLESWVGSEWVGRSHLCVCRVGTPPRRVNNYSIGCYSDRVIEENTGKTRDSVGPRSIGRSAPAARWRPPYYDRRTSPRAASGSPRSSAPAGLSRSRPHRSGQAGPLARCSPPCIARSQGGWAPPSRSAARTRSSRPTGCPRSAFFAPPSEFALRGALGDVEREARGQVERRSEPGAGRHHQLHAPSRRAHRAHSRGEGACVVRHSVTNGSERSDVKCAVARGRGHFLVELAPQRVREATVRQRQQRRTAPHLTTRGLRSPGRRVRLRSTGRRVRLPVAIYLSIYLSIWQARPSRRKTRKQAASLSIYLSICAVCVRLFFQKPI